MEVVFGGAVEADLRHHRLLLRHPRQLCALDEVGPPPVCCMNTSMASSSTMSNVAGVSASCIRLPSNTNLKHLESDSSFERQVKFMNFDQLRSSP